MVSTKPFKVLPWNADSDLVVLLEVSEFSTAKPFNNDCDRSPLFINCVAPHCAIEAPCLLTVKDSLPTDLPTISISNPLSSTISLVPAEPKSVCLYVTVFPSAEYRVTNWSEGRLAISNIFELAPILPPRFKIFTVTLLHVSILGDTADRSNIVVVGNIFIYPSTKTLAADPPIFTQVKVPSKSWIW